MSIKSDILEKHNGVYTAMYGWQKNLGDDLFTFGYIDSYKSTADLLVDQKRPDLYIFPMIFCYRQYLELVLKNICYVKMNKSKYQRLIKEASHSLKKVWDKAITFLKDILNNSQLNDITEIIEFFESIDPNSFNFRYEFDKKLNRSIKEEYFEINTYELKRWMDTIDNYLRFTYDSI